MRSVASVALACLLAVANAHPRGHVWITDTCYPNPGNTDNDCTQMVEDGFDWTDLNPGSFSSYGGLDFSGFICKDPAGDNDLGKYIEGKLSTGHSALEISGSSEWQDEFSITDFYLTTSKKAKVNIIYNMPDGSRCRNVALCSPEKTHITNEQCGGAVSVNFELPKDSKEDDLSLGIHSIEFDCGPADHPKTTSTTPAIPSVTGGSSTITPSSSVPVITQSSTIPPSIPSSVAPTTKSTPLIPSSRPTGSVPITTPAPSAPAPSSTLPPGGSVTTVVTYETVTTCPVTTTITTGGSEIPTTYTTVSTVTQTSTSTVCTRCATPTDVPTESLPETTPGPSDVHPGGSSTAPGNSVTTVVTYETVTTCPVTATITTGGSEIPTTYTTVSTITRISTSTVCTECSSPTGTSPTIPDNTPVPSAPCPNSVPKCINTWLTKMPKCNSNSDASCFCPDSDFTSKVISCIQAWGASDAEIQAALSYFTGICSAFVPENPGIITDIPTTITLVPTVAPTPPPTGVAGVPQTQPETQTQAPPQHQPPVATTPPPATIITYSSYTVTVPQVQFTTGAGETGQVGLIPAATTTANLATTSSRGLFSTLYTAPQPSVVASSRTPSGSASVPISTGGAVGVTTPSMKEMVGGVWTAVVVGVLGLVLV